MDHTLTVLNYWLSECPKYSQPTPIAGGLQGKMIRKSKHIVVKKIKKCLCLLENFQQWILNLGHMKYPNRLSIVGKVRVSGQHFSALNTLKKNLPEPVTKWVFLLYCYLYLKRRYFDFADNMDIKKNLMLVVLLTSHFNTVAVLISIKWYNRTHWAEYWCIVILVEFCFAYWSFVNWSADIISDSNCHPHP